MRWQSNRMGRLFWRGGCFASEIGGQGLCIARLTATGAVDTSFGTGGVAKSALGTFSNELLTLALLADGKIVAGGRCTDGGFLYVMCLMRVNSDGSIDVTFDGPNTVSPGNGAFKLAVAPWARVNGIAVQSDGKLVVAGQCRPVTNGTSYMCVARLGTTGAFDSTFGTGGIVALNVLASSSATAIAIQPDARIAVSGWCADSFCVVRLNGNGTLDLTFDGDSGTANGAVLLPVIGPFFDTSNALALFPDGRIALVGKCRMTAPPNPTDSTCVARLTPDGKLDTTFDGPDTVSPGNGKFVLPIVAGHNEAISGSVQPDGSLNIVGLCNNTTTGIDFCIARLNGGPFPAKQCSMDVDGDGAVTATIDSLIHARVALGMRGNSVTGGIAFAAHATRSNWTSIRNFLVMHCGMAIP
jgi:uncharacterized delta-60 repeat protein